MHIYRDGHLVLDNQLTWSFLGKISSPLCCLKFFVYSWTLIEFPRSILLCSLVSSLFSLHFWNHVCETLWVPLWESLWDTIPQQSRSSGSYMYLPLFHIYPWAVCVEIMLQIHPVKLGLRVSHFDLLWFLLIYSICYKKKFVDEG